MTLKKYPIGISTLEKIREEGYYYVDKSHFIEKLVKKGAYYFLSRPRRFGKSLFLDTLKQAFLGNKKVFERLYLEKHWDFDNIYPVIYIDYGVNNPLSTTPELKQHIIKLLSNVARDYEINLNEKDNCFDQFKDLIVLLQKKFNKKVVILIDEYDKPILDAIEDIPRAEEIREVLKSFYSVIKASDAYVQFAFLTGVSKFAKAGIFSGLNNLQDITYHDDYSDICGITQEELENIYAEPIDDLALSLNMNKSLCLSKIKEWYNGYQFSRTKVSVYNPFSTLNLFSAKDFKNYWFQTGTPSFLIKLMLKGHYPFKNLENARIDVDLTETFDLNHLEPTIILFQAGYLTISRVETFGNSTEYILKLPNVEVKQSLYNALMGYIYECSSIPYKDVFIKALKIHEPSDMEVSFKGLLSSLPHHWYTNNQLTHYEGFYCSVVYAFMAGIGVEVIPEDVTNNGRIDFTLKALGIIYIFEFKVVDEDDAQSNALQQIKDKRYAEKYKIDNQRIFLIGIHFSKAERNVIKFEWEKLV